MTIDAEQNRQFPLAIDLNKILPDLLKLRTKAEKSDIQFSQHTYVKVPQAQLTVSLILFSFCHKKSFQLSIGIFSFFL